MNTVPGMATLPPNFATREVSSRGATAARDFEASLIGSLLESLEKTFASVPGQNSSAGSDDYNYIATRGLAQALADHGGFGIAALISQHLPVHEGKGQLESSGSEGQAAAPKVPATAADGRR
jgi:Rod binding domain-containing protein